MGSNEKTVQLKVFVDKKKKKVMFAEAEEDLVDILFSFFMLPLGTIARLSSSTHADLQVGSLTSLYESIVNLNGKHFTNDGCKDALVNPRNSSASVFQRLKVNLDDRNLVGAAVDDSDQGFVKKSSFIITDGLNVLPVLRNTSNILLNSLGFQNIDLLDERTMRFGVEEFLSLLKWSLVTNNPLTNLVFLTIPLGTVKRLTMDNSSSMALNNLYNSITSLGDENYLESEDIKTMLLYPKLAANYQRVTDFLPIYELSTIPGRFLKEQATFIVSDDLKVTVPSPSPSTSTLSMFNTLGIPDTEVVEMSIGEQEALLILKAYFTSTSVLTDCLNAFIKKREAEPSS
ncbi:hypothetical protein L6452_36900 [Arctium lappa]|uniref:Uncharacterized protein n=1 Tax=Arctium lappa TaxID=4217 RepID=A0ACB8Y1D8_ARCLA|nr:hypothetical protein L6452_36900 [Arctium lappa]